MLLILLYGDSNRFYYVFFLFSNNLYYIVNLTVEIGDYSLDEFYALYYKT